MPGCSDVVRDGWSGLLVPSHAPPLLAAGIINLLKDRHAAASMGARASKLVKEEFGLDLTVTRYLTAYGELLDKPIRGGMQAKHPASRLQKRYS
jgi:glycosyltransferase involved in cell wall biosynthesis